MTLWPFVERNTRYRELALLELGLVGVTPGNAGQEGIDGLESHDVSVLSSGLLWRRHPGRSGGDAGPSWNEKWMIRRRPKLAEIGVPTPC